MEQLKPPVTAACFATALLSATHTLAAETLYIRRCHNEVQFAWSPASVSIDTFSPAHGGAAQLATSETIPWAPETSITPA